MTATAGPRVVDALYELFVAALGDDVEVVDGYAFSDANAAQLTIGISDRTDPNNTPAVRSTQEPLGGFGDQRQEFVTVVCRLTAYPSGSTLKSARDFLVTTLTTVDSAVRANRTLGGVVQDTRLGPDFELHQADGPAGDRLRYDFTIVADVYL